MSLEETFLLLEKSFDVNIVNFVINTKNSTVVISMYRFRFVHKNDLIFLGSFLVMYNTGQIAS